MKKLALFLAIVASFTTQALAYDFQAGNLLYTIISTDPPKVRLDRHSDGQAAQGEILIPETVTYEGIDYTVAVIAESAFFQCYHITSVIFSNGLEEIRRRAFHKCLGLQHISDFPESLTEIGEEAFRSCTALSGTVVFPSQITTIREWSFSACGITGVVFPNGLTTIKQDAFISTPLTSLHIPASVTSISDYAFVDTRLESITVDEANPVYDSRSNCNALIETATNTLITGCFNTVIPNSIVTIGNGAFINCDGLTSIVIPEGVTRIEDNAFWDCGFLETVVLPATLNYIGKKAFLCYGITSIISKSSVPPVAIYDTYDFSNNSFGGMSHNIPVHIPFGTAQAYSDAEGWNYFSNFIEEEPIIYTDFEPDLCVSWVSAPYPHDTIKIDFDQDGAIDFKVFLSWRSTGEIAIDMISSWEHRYKIYNSDSIVPSDEVYPSIHYWLTPNYPWQYMFIDTNYLEDYIGFRKTINGENYYAWVSVHAVEQHTSSSNMVGAYVDRVAYCTIPDYPLRWGQTSMESIAWEGSEWYYEIQNDDGSITYQHLECVGDTLFDRAGKRPKIIVRSNTHYDREEIEVTHEYVYEEIGFVYWWNKDLEEFTKLYDLNANLGDEWEIKVGTETLTMHVEEVNYYEYEGKTYRMLTVSDPENLFSGDIVCGIGHLTSFFPEKLMNQGKGYRVDGLRCYWVEDALLYHNGDGDCDAIYCELHGIEENDHSAPSTGSGTEGSEALTVYPNPANGVLFVRLPQCDSPTTGKNEYHITNLMGQTLLQGSINAENQQIDIANLPAGMYFISVDGETVKFVVK